MESTSLISDLSRTYQSLFQKRQIIMTFSGFLDRVQESPKAMIRNAPQYLLDAMEHFGSRPLTKDENMSGGNDRMKLFDLGSERTGPIIGGEAVQDEIRTLIKSLVRQGQANKLILLHGPNGSAKTSTIEALSHGLQRYSETDVGAVYKFNWIFPTDRAGAPRMKGDASAIGFAANRDDETSPYGGASYAMLDEPDISSKIHSEFKENPIFLIPMPEREKWLREWIAAKEGISPDKVELPPHVLLSGLSKRNQLILENLLNAYDGNLAKVFRHVQVERFFYSRQYRVGISTVEPQMSVDAVEKQLTMDKNIQNLPTVLHNIRFHESQGELIESNRGIIEFSDLLKRPVEAFKYLLSTVEKSSLTLPSGTANLDVVFLGTTNEKHLDAFKTNPDFSSFRGRFELITVPYLLRYSEEEKIYASDVHALRKSTKVTPHSVEMLCLWSVLTRLKQPDVEHYDAQVRGLVGRLDPLSKAKLYDGRTLFPTFKPHEEQVLREIREKIFTESIGLVVYEGRFGASPREVRAILHRASQQGQHPALTPMAIFDELDRMVKDRTVYEFLQFEPRGKYHDAVGFVGMVKDHFADIFHDEILRSMTLVEEGQYDQLLRRYIDHVVAEVKKERIYNPGTSAYEAPNQTIMRELEQIIGIKGSVEKFRESILSRSAAFKIENPKATLNVSAVFSDILTKIEEHYYGEKTKIVESNFRAMLLLGTPEERELNDKERKLAAVTFAELEKRFGYDLDSARGCLKFLLAQRSQKKS